VRKEHYKTSGDGARKALEAMEAILNELKKWVLVYGRRKTGKTFLVTIFVKYDEYFSSQIAG